MTLAWAAQEKRNRILELKGIIEKVFKTNDAIDLRKLLNELFEKKGYAPAASMRYLKELALIMNFTIDEKENMIRRK